MSTFRDRTEAGERLATALEGREFDRPIVLGLPRGGVPVAVPVAERLGAPLDVLVSRKLGAPMQPELGFGAISEAGALWVDEETVQLLGLEKTSIDAIAARERAEMERRVRAFRGGRPLRLEGRTAVLVDDGVATGGTVRAAVRAARHRGAGRGVVAGPRAAAAAPAGVPPGVPAGACL